MAKHDLTMLGAMVACEAITFDQASQWVEFCTHVDVQCVLPVSLEAAVDLALDYFHDDPDTEAAAVAEQIAAHAAAPHGNCCECGEALDPDEMVTEIDFDMAVDAWVMLRDMVRLRDSIMHDESEEC